jgi:hypothetical protein
MPAGRQRPELPPGQRRRTPASTRSHGGYLPAQPDSTFSVERRKIGRNLHADIEAFAWTGQRRPQAREWTHGGQLNALIVTKNELPVGEPIRVIVVYDLPILSAALKFD